MSKAENQPIPILGAFEVFTPEGSSSPIKEELTTLTTRGSVLEAGDLLPTNLQGSYFNPDTKLLEPDFRLIPEKGVRLIAAVNEFGTPTCVQCTEQLDHAFETFMTDHPGVDVSIISLGRLHDDGQTFTPGSPEERAAGRLQHPRVFIDQKTAVELSLAVEPGKNADPDFWMGALRRGVIVVTPDGMVHGAEFPQDQETKPNLQTAFATVSRVLS